MDDEELERTSFVSYSGRVDGGIGSSGYRVALARTSLGPARFVVAVEAVKDRDIAFDAPAFAGGATEAGTVD